jgi:O-methyltransferase involved in polyketide biosynthesis
MNEKTKITLTPEQETLLIVLYTKAQPDNPLFFDPIAQDILERVDYDFKGLRVPYKTVVLVCQRAKKMDAVTRGFLAENPGGVVLHLGCGLDGRFWRVDDGKVSWYDLDMPPVVALRNQFYPENERYHMIASTVTDLAWVDTVDARGRPVLVVAEGLLMYLGDADVKRLLLRLQTAFPGCRLVADVFSRMTARSATRHPSLKQTRATLGWGVDDPHEIEAWSPGIRLLEEWYFTQDPDLARLSLGYRLAYKVAGAFKVVQRAHRILYYQLLKAEGDNPNLENPSSQNENMTRETLH